jgi:hypothetical protein
MVEHAAVNRGVEGSSPSSGANLKAVEHQGRLVPKEGKNPQLSGKLSGKLSGESYGLAAQNGRAKSFL